MTPERFARLEAVLDARQPDLTVLMDNVNKVHNFSAIVRTCDAVGILEAHAVWPDPRLRPNHKTSGGVGKWVRVRTHANVESALSAFMGSGFQVLAAHISERSVDFRTVDYTRPTVLVMGAELSGVSDAASNAAQGHIRIPMHGMVKSLNVAVAAATILFEAERQRRATGMYTTSRLDPALRRETLFEWAHPDVAAYCRRHGFAYPPLDEHGELGAALPRRS